MNDILKGIGFDKTKTLNFLTAQDYYDRLKIIALSLYEWKGLPESCNDRSLEMTLYTYGKAIFVNDPMLGFLNLKVNPGGKYNFYDEAVSYNAYGIDYQKEYPADQCVLIRNNLLERSTDETLRLFAQRLAEAERTLDVNIKAQKTPVIVRCDDKDRLTMKNLYSQYEGNEPFILGSKSLNIEGLKTISTEAPYVADKVMIYKKDIWNEAMTFLGLNNANTDKRERLIKDEVNSNNDLIDIMAQTMLLTRQDAAAKMTKMYGKPITVQKRELFGSAAITDEDEDPEDKEE